MQIRRSEWNIERDPITFKRARERAKGDVMLYVAIASVIVSILLLLFTWVLPVSRGRTLREILLERRKIKKLRWDVIYFAERMSMETWNFPEFGDMLNSKGDFSGLSIFRDGDIYVRKTRLQCSKTQRKRVRKLYHIIMSSCGHYQHTEEELINSIVVRKQNQL